MRAIISAVLTAIALTFSATAAMVFDADLESLLARIQTHEHTGDFEEFASNPVCNSTSVGPRQDCFRHNQRQEGGGGTGNISPG